MIISKETTIKRLGKEDLVLDCNPRNGFSPPQSVGFSENSTDESNISNDTFVSVGDWVSVDSFSPTWTLPSDTKTIKLFLETQGGEGKNTIRNCLNQCCLDIVDIPETCSTGAVCGPEIETPCPDGDICGGLQCNETGNCISEDCVPCRCDNYSDCDDQSGFTIPAKVTATSVKLHHGGPLYDSRYFLSEDFQPPSWYWEMQGRKMWDPVKGGPLFVGKSDFEFESTTPLLNKQSRGFSFGGPGEEVIIFARSEEGATDTTCNFCNSNVNCSAAGCGGTTGLGVVLSYTLGPDFCVEDTVQIKINPLASSSAGRKKYFVTVTVVDQSGVDHDIFEESISYGEDASFSGGQLGLCSFNCNSCRWECPACDIPNDSYWRSVWYENNVRNQPEEEFPEGENQTGLIYNVDGTHEQQSSVLVSDGTTRTVTRTGGSVTQIGNSLVNVAEAGEETGNTTSSAWFAMNDSVVNGASAGGGSTAANTNLLDGNYGASGTGTAIFQGEIGGVGITGPCSCPPGSFVETLSGPGFAIITAN